MARVNAAVHVDGQRWVLANSFANDPARWLPLPAVPSGEMAWRSTVHGGPVLQTVQVRLGYVRHLPDAFTRHLLWVPGDHRGSLAGRILPTFEGQLRVQHWHPPGVDLVLAGHYRPPGGRAGNLLDAVAMHRVADTTVRRFLEDIAERLTVAALTTV